MSVRFVMLPVLMLMGLIVATSTYADIVLGNGAVLGDGATTEGLVTPPPVTGFTTKCETFVFEQPANPRCVGTFGQYCVLQRNVLPSRTVDNVIYYVDLDGTNTSVSFVVYRCGNGASCDDPNLVTQGFQGSTAYVATNTESQSTPTQANNLSAQDQVGIFIDIDETQGEVNALHVSLCDQ